MIIYYNYICAGYELKSIVSKKKNGGTNLQILELKEAQDSFSDDD